MSVWLTLLGPRRSATRKDMQPTISFLRGQGVEDGEGKMVGRVRSRWWAG